MSNRSCIRSTDFPTEWEGALTTKIETPAVVAEVPDQKADIRTVSKIRAEKFVDLVKSGETPSTAAKECHTSLSLLQVDPDVKAVVAGLIDQYTFPAETRKKLVRAKVNQVLVSGTNKEALEAAKIASQDPELGIGPGAPQVNTQINFSPELTSFLAETQLPDEFSLTPEIPAIDAQLIDDGSNSGSNSSNPDA